MSDRSSVAVAVCLVGMLAVGCSGASPAAPAAVPAGSPAAERVASAEPAFLLAEGTLVITSPKGTISGTYSGDATSTGAALTVVLTGGTEQFAGASGTLTGAGRGAFAGEGDFTLVIQGRATTSRGTRQMRISIHGMASLSCVADVPVISQAGTGNATGIGRITAALRHKVASGAGCSDG